MRQAAQAGRISALFVYQPDRLSSDLGQLAMLMEELRGHGVKVRFAEGSKYSGLEAFTVGILEYVSQMERADAAERSMRARIRPARSGILPVGINPGLFGYDYDKVRKVRTVNETEAGAVRLLFQWACEGVPTYRIAERLNARGIRTKRGCCWTQLAVRRILMNCAFTGVQCYGKDGYRGTAGKKRAAILRPDSEVIRVVGFSPPIISQELYDTIPGAPRGEADRGNEIASVMPGWRVFILREMRRQGRGRQYATVPVPSLPMPCFGYGFHPACDGSYGPVNGFGGGGAEGIGRMRVSYRCAAFGVAGAFLHGRRRPGPEDGVAAHGNP